MPAARVHTLPSELTGHAGSGDASSSSVYERLSHQLHHDRQWHQDVSLGKRVGFYRMRGDLGAGNFSHVKMAVHQLTSERVAIKILDKSKLDQKTRRMVAREISNMEKIHHPNIIRLYEVVETYSKLHLVLEFAAGGELFHKISTLGRLQEVHAKVVFGQVVSGVHYLHSLGIIHRDIKAENVFCAGPTLVKLGDFGFSTQLVSGAQQQLNTFCGSPPYAAPELFRDESYRGPPVDVWALGVLLAFTVTGHMPFRAPTVASLKRHILEGHFSLPAHLSDACQGLIEAILRQAPSERLTLEQILASEWLRGTALPATPADDEDWVTLPTRDSSPAALNDVETRARERLHTLGVTEALLQEHLEKGVRSPVVGTYRIVVHRLQKQASSQPATPDTAVGCEANFHTAKETDISSRSSTDQRERQGPGGGHAGADPGPQQVRGRGLFRKSKSAAVKRTSNEQATVRSKTCTLL